MGHDITPDQLNALVQFAAKRLGMSPQELAKTVQTQGLDGLAGHLSPQDSAKMKGMADKRGQAEQILQSPQAQALLKQLMNGET